MRFILTIQCDNDAFAGADLFPEVARIVRGVAEKAEHGDCGQVRDVNGNTCGEFVWMPDKRKRGSRGA